MFRLFGILFILTGVFAIVGGLYTWGDGNLIHQNELVKVLIPWADIIITGPLSIICGSGILKRLYWGNILGLLVSGIYIFGSVLVILLIFWKEDYSIFLIIPSFAGLIIGLGFTILMLKSNSAKS